MTTANATHVEAIRRWTEIGRCVTLGRLTIGGSCMVLPPAATLPDPQQLPQRLGRHLAAARLLPLGVPIQGIDELLLHNHADLAPISVDRRSARTSTRAAGVGPGDGGPGRMVLPRRRRAVRVWGAGSLPDVVQLRADERQVSQDEEAERHGRQ
jgi:hypothetical protein